MNLLEELVSKKLITPEPFVASGLQLLHIVGSTAYGISNSSSDIDIMGICIPPKEYVYQPGIFGFDEQNIFKEFQQHHVKDGELEYDFKIYPLPRLFKLAFDGNPNILDFLLVNQEHVLFQTKIGKRIREFAPMFCSKQTIPRYFGFARNHFKTILRKKEDISNINPKRRVLYEKFGYDTKDAGHCIRSILCLKEILFSGVYDVRSHSDFIIEIRNGQYSLDELTLLINDLEAEVKDLAPKSPLRETPDFKLCHGELTSMLEEYYGV